MRPQSRSHKFAVLLSAALATACAGEVEDDNDGAAPSAQDFDPDQLEAATSVEGMVTEPLPEDWGESLSDEDWARIHPAFAEKISDPDAYSVRESLLGPDALAADRTAESKCGSTWDVQNVEAYDGRYAGLGFPDYRIDQWEPSTGILRLAVDGEGFVCSGTLIDSNLFLTASHCIDDGFDIAVVDFNFQLSPTGLPRPVSRFNVTSVVEDGASAGLDFAILRLSGNPGATFGTRSVRPNDATELAIIQHPNGSRKGIDAGTCEELSGQFVEYGNIDTAGGSSGAGILDNYGRLVGVHTTGGCNTIFSGHDNEGVRMSFIASASPTITNLYMNPLPGRALDIDAGGGELFVIGTSRRIFRWNLAQARWDLFSSFRADRIAVGPDGLPVVVRASDGGIFQINANGSATALPGTAHDVGVGGDGRIWIISRVPHRRNFRIQRFHAPSQQWFDMGGSSMRISVGEDGVPWVVSAANRISRRVGGQWQLLPGSVVDVSAGEDEDDVMVVATSNAPGGKTIWRFDADGNTWKRVLAAGVAVATGSGANISGDYMILANNQIRYLGE